MPKVLDKDAIASILESSNEEDDFSDGSNDNYEPSDSEVLSADERSTEDDSEEDAEEALPTTHSTDCAQNTIWSSPNPEFVPRKSLISYRLPDISQRFDRTDNPYNLFMKIFPESLFMRITQCTHERIEIMRKSKPAYKNVKLTDIGEIKVVIGCMIIMSYNRLPSVKHYWSNKWWKKVFYRLLMMSVGNCWVISSQLGRRQNPLLDFMIVLAENMIAEGKKRAAVSRSGTSG